jgi:GH25 family lysozyme M1 (1,4-beta-N-acetylmuramidase)
MKYIDVSEHQHTIDWEKVKGHIDGVIIRAGYGQNHIDKTFIDNVTACNRLGIPCGAYWFSYAYTPEMAKKEAEYLLKAVAPYKMELPLAFDWEYDSNAYAIKHGVVSTRELVQEMTKAFCGVIEAAKYYCMLYTNVDYINKFFGELAGGRYDLWLASWPKVVDVSKPPRKCGIWQWGGSAVPGIEGNVDSNEAYNDYKALIAKIGFNIPARPWYAEAQDWAKSAGISDGDRPTDPATRAEVWQMLYNYFRKNVGTGTGNARMSGLIDD